MNVEQPIPGNKISGDVQFKMDALMKLAEPYLLDIVDTLLKNGIAVSDFALTVLPPNLEKIKPTDTPPPDLIEMVKVIIDKAYPETESSLYTKNFTVSVAIGEVLMEARRRDKNSLARELGELIKKLN